MWSEIFTEPRVGPPSDKRYREESIERLKEKPKGRRHPKISSQTGRIQDKDHFEGKKQISRRDYKTGRRTNRREK